VVDCFGEHGADDAEVVGDFGCVGHEVADGRGTVAVRFEVGERAGEREAGLIAAHASEALALADGVGELPAVLVAEEGFGVEGFELGGAAGLEEVDDAFGFGGEVEGGEEAGGGLGLLLEFFTEDGAKGKATEAKSGHAEEVAAGEAHELVVVGRHGIPSGL